MDFLLNYAAFSVAGVESPSPQTSDTLVNAGGSQARAQPPDAEAADAVADELGDLPLALAQAAAYVGQTQCSLGEYLGLLRERPEKMLDVGDELGEYGRSVFKTYQLAARDLGKKNRPALNLLSLCAYLAPEEIPRHVLARHFDGDAEKLNKALIALRKYALAEVTEQTVSFHRLVQAVCRARLRKPQQNKWAEAAVELIDSAWPPGNAQEDPKFWPLVTDLNPHGLAAIDHASKLHIAAATVSRLLSQTGAYHYIRALFNTAEANWAKALEISESAHGAEHPRVANCLNNLATLLQATNRLAEAEPLMRRALEIFRDSLGDEHPNTKIVAENYERLRRAMKS